MTNRMLAMGFSVQQVDEALRRFQVLHASVPQYEQRPYCSTSSVRVVVVAEVAVAVVAAYQECCLCLTTPLRLTVEWSNSRRLAATSQPTCSAEEAEEVARAMHLRAQYAMSCTTIADFGVRSWYALSGTDVGHGVVPDGSGEDMFCGGGGELRYLLHAC
eukprot:3836581-Rhodomonas_salina.1